MNSIEWVVLIIAAIFAIDVIVYLCCKVYWAYKARNEFTQLERQIQSVEGKIRKLLESAQSQAEDLKMLGEAKKALKSLDDALKEFRKSKRQIVEMVRYLASLLEILTNFRDIEEELIVKLSDEDIDEWEQIWYEAAKLECVIVNLVNNIIYTKEGHVLIQKARANLAIYKKQLNIRLADWNDTTERKIVDMLCVLDKVNRGADLSKEDLLKHGKNFLRFNFFEVYNMFELLETASIASQGLVLMAFNVSGGTMEIASRDLFEELYIYSYEDVSRIESEFKDKKFNSLKKFKKYLKSRAISKYMKNASNRMLEYWEDPRCKE